MNSSPPLRRGPALMLLALAVGAAGGFWAGRQWPGPAGGGARGRTGPLTASDGRGEGMEGAGAALKGANTGFPGRTGPVVIPRGDSTGQTLRNILAIPDTLERLATLRAWCLELPPAGVIAMMAEFKKMMEAQERIGELEGMGLFFQSMDVISQALMEQGVGPAMEAFLAPAAEGEDSGLREGAGTLLFTKWAAQDLPAARAFLEGRLSQAPEAGEDSNALKEMSKSLMRSWVKTDPDAAMAWLLQQRKSIADDAISPAFQALSHHNPDKALELVAAQAELPGRDRIAAVIAEWWAKTTPDKALAWAQGLPEKLAGPSVKEAIGSWAQRDFAAAKEALGGLSAPLQQAALPALVQRWEKGQWSDAAAFLEQQANGPGREEAVGHLIRNWVEGDQQAASAWLNRQPASPARDAGASALAGELRASDPEVAAIWGATLSDSAQRQESLRNTLQAWYKKSVPEALNWLQTAPNLTDSDRAALLGSVPAPAK